jgi:hypothetical protein
VSTKSALKECWRSIMHPCWVLIRICDGSTAMHV